MPIFEKEFLSENYENVYLVPRQSAEETQHKGLTRDTQYKCQSV